MHNQDNVRRCHKLKAPIQRFSESDMCEVHAFAIYQFVLSVGLFIFVGLGFLDLSVGYNDLSKFVSVNALPLKTLTHAKASLVIWCCAAVHGQVVDFVADAMEVTLSERLDKAVTVPDSATGNMGCHGLPGLLHAEAHPYSLKLREFGEMPGSKQSWHDLVNLWIGQPASTCT